MFWVYASSHVSKVQCPMSVHAKRLLTLDIELWTFDFITPAPSLPVDSPSSVLNTAEAVPWSLLRSLSATLPALLQTDRRVPRDFATTAHRAVANETSDPIACRAEYEVAPFLQPLALQSSLPAQLPAQSAVRSRKCCRPCA